jgi:hypothetical protein
MRSDKKIKNSEAKGKSLIFFLSNSEHNKTRNISCLILSRSSGSAPMPVVPSTSDKMH